MKNLEVTVGEKKIRLYDLMYDMKENLKCSFHFKFNLKREIVMSCTLLSGDIFCCFIINTAGNQHCAYQLFASDEQRHHFATLYENQRLFSMVSCDSLIDSVKINKMESSQNPGEKKRKKKRRQTERRSTDSAGSRRI